MMFTSLALLTLGSVSAHNDEDRFTTGPPAVAPDRQGTPILPRADDLGPGLRGGADGTDILVNVARQSAQNETSFAINPLDQDNWVGVANDYRNGGVETGWYSSLDAGATWTTGTFGVKSGFSFSGDPCVTFTPNGTCHVVCMMYSGPGGSQVTGFRSIDGGQTWSGETPIDLNDANDKPQLDADLSQGPHRGDITTAWDRFTGSPDIHVSTTGDDGLSWSNQQQINGSNSQNTISPDVAYAADSVLYVMWADRGSDDIWVDRSTDGGASWGADLLVSSYTPVPSPIPGSNFRNFDIFSMAADWTDGPYSGNVYIASQQWRASNDADVRCHTSSDGGLSWTSTQVHTDADNRDQVFPGVDTDPQGNVHVSYYDRRLDPADLLLWTWVSRSCDGGASWKEYQVSDVGWDHRSTEFSGGFIGDYCDVDCSTHRVMPFWCDGRLLSGDSSRTQDVYTDSMVLDLTTDLDSISATTGGSVQFQIEVGPNHQAETYFLLGSFSGTMPGIDLQGVNVPINWDFLSLLTLTQANGAVFQNFRGILDAGGAASATLDSQGPFDTAAAGLDLDFAVLVQAAGRASFATNPTRVRIEL